MNRYLPHALLAALLAALSASVLSQSTPGFVFGQVPTAAQWNSYFAAKMDYFVGGLPINRGGTEATTAAGARLNLGLGTSAIYPIGTSGVAVPLLSTANSWTLQQTFAVPTGTPPFAVASTTMVPNLYAERALSSDGAAGLTVAPGKMLTVDNTLTLSGTDGTSFVFPATSATLARTDAAQTFTGVQTLSSSPVVSALTASQAVFTNGDKELVSNAITGTGSVVMATSPTLVTPDLGAATATSVNKVVLTAPATAATLTIVDGKTLTASNSLTLAGTDATTMTFPTTSASVARTDAAQSFTGTQTFASVALGSLALSSTAPTIASGGCTDPAVTWHNGTAAFLVTVGTSCTGVTQVTLTLPAAANLWACRAENNTSNAQQAANVVAARATSATAVVLTNYARTTGLAADFTASDTLLVSCVGG
jgi:hypothetical protein